MIHVTTLAILDDNYCFILQSSDGKCAVLDAGVAAPVIAYLEKHNLKPDFILSTHHHWDHVNGNHELSQKYNAPIFVPIGDSNKIKYYNYVMKDNEYFTLDSSARAKIIHTPGHTNGAICLYFEESKILFSGDTIFSLGCGRLFEGTAEDMFHSFQKIAALPDDTMIYCGHEYTLTNAEFCKNITPDNPDLLNRIEDARKLRLLNFPTIPVSLITEKNTNVFFRAETPAEFSHLRELRNNFKL